MNHSALLAAFQYAVLTRGDLDVLKHDPSSWAAAFDTTSAQDWAQVVPHLTSTDKHLLDIGCGMGAFDIYAIKQAGLHATLLDGEDAIPMVVNQDMPFMKREVVTNFLKFNGCPEDKFDYVTPETWNLAPVVDVVVSLRSWCFHYAPATYLQKVLDLKPRMVVVDMRVDKPEWRQQMASVFKFGRCIGVAPNGKWHRNVYTARGDA